MTTLKTKPHVTFVRGPIVCAEGSINNEATPCIAFAYLSGMIHHQGYPVTIVDAIAEGLNHLWPIPQREGFVAHGLSFDEILAKIPADTEVIAFSGMFSSEWPVLRELILQARKQFPEILFIAGGEHMTALSEYSLRDCPALNLIIRGEGEQALLHLLDVYTETRDFTQAEGISYLDNNGVYCQKATPRIRNANTVPWPYWPEGYMEKFWSAGKSYGVLTERDMPFMASRGCPYRCTFCSNPQMWGFLYTVRDPDDCMAEIHSYMSRYKITSLQFYDLTAITKKDWIVAFCNKLIDSGLNIKWSLPSGTRSEVLDTETLSLLKRSGCHYLVYAPESGSPRTLKNIKKQIKLELLTESVYEAIRQGIVVRTNLIIGFPSETRLDIYKTILFGLKMSFRGVDEAPIFLYNPYPGSEIFKELIDAGKITLNDNYFFSLTSLNGQYVSLRSLSFNPNVGPLELVIYRSIFMLLNYIISYLFYPGRVIRSLKNIISSTSQSATVFEHRMKDAFHRKQIPS